MSQRDSDDSKARFLEALEKKKNLQTERISSRTEKKVKGSQMAGNSQKMFRRKSGSA
jgi:hypothetical protein